MALFGSLLKTLVLLDAAKDGGIGLDTFVAVAAAVAVVAVVKFVVVVAFVVDVVA